MDNHCEYFGNCDESCFYPTECYNFQPYSCVTIPSMEEDKGLYYKEICIFPLVKHNG